MRFHWNCVCFCLIWWPCSKFSERQKCFGAYFCVWPALHWASQHFWFVALFFDFFYLLEVGCTANLFKDWQTLNFALIVKEKGALVLGVLHFCERLKDSEMGLVEAFLKGCQLLFSVFENALLTLKTNFVVEVSAVTLFEEGKCVFFGAVHGCAKLLLAVCEWANVSFGTALWFEEVDAFALLEFLGQVHAPLETHPKNGPHLAYLTLHGASLEAEAEVLMLETHGLHSNHYCTTFWVLFN